jgi:hypothetical protein
MLRWLARLITTIGVLVSFSQVDLVETWRLKHSSDNGEYLVVFTPAGAFFDPCKGRLAAPEEQRTTTLLEVLRNGTEPVWSVVPKAQDFSEGSLFVSDDGRFVVTFDPRQPADTLDPVLTFYSRQGQIRQFMPHELLEMTEKEFALKFGSADQPTNRYQPLAVQSTIRWCWPSISFFSSLDGRDCFCLWLGQDDRWLAWTLDDARRFTLNEELITQCNERGRSLSLRTMTPDDDDSLAGPVFHYFLAARRNPEDRKGFEDMLNQRDRPPIHQSLFHEAKKNDPPQHIVRWPRRWLADTLLAIWDKKMTITDVSDHKQELLWSEKSYFLGSFSGKVQLPVSPTKTDGPLWLFLIPATANKTVFASTEIEQPLRFEFEYLRPDVPQGKAEEILVRDLPPGDYWIKAIWDKSAPFADDEATIPVPGTGDFQSTGGQMITIRAGETTKDVTVDCLTEVVAP